VGDQAPGAVAHARRLIDESPHNSLLKQMEQERDAVLQLAGREEMEEGIAAFFEKRAPRWQDDN
jgi:enoyl-CoA hydratase/carnithine racemase